MKPRGLLLGLLWAVVACQAWGEAGRLDFGEPDQTAVPVSFINLIATPDQFQRKSVKFYAVIMTGFETHYLVFSKEKLAVGDLPSAIEYEIENSKLGMSQSEWKALDGKHVLVDGRFRTGVRDNGERINCIAPITRIRRAEK